MDKMSNLCQKNSTIPIKVIVLHMASCYSLIGSPTGLINRHSDIPNIRLDKR